MTANAPEAPDSTSPSRRSTARLVGDVPRLTVELAQTELASLVADVKARLVAAGIGAGLIVVAGLFGFFGLATLIAAGVLGLSTVMNGWLAALLVMLVLLIIVAIAAVTGVRSFTRGVHGAENDDAADRKDDARGS